MTEYRFNFELEPQQQERPRATRRGNFIRMYDPPKTARFKNDLKQLAKLKMAGKDKLEGSLKVDLTFGRAVQKSISGKERLRRLTGVHRPTVKPDLDNYIKSTLDALNGVIWKDDAQIVSLKADKIYAEHPGISVVVKKVGE